MKNTVLWKISKKYYDIVVSAYVSKYQVIELINPEVQYKYKHEPQTQKKRFITYIDLVEV